MARAISKMSKPVESPIDGSQATTPRASRDESVEGDSLALYELTAQERHARIAEVAYRLAERRGFAPGSETSDWLAAEREVDAERPTNDVV